MILFLKRTLKGLFAGTFLNMVTIITIALSILIISAFILVLNNTDAILNSWTKDIRIMAYLEGGLTEEAVGEINQNIENISGVSAVRFISKEEGLKRLKKELENQGSIFDNLNENPLPDAFEITPEEAGHSMDNLSSIASALRGNKGIAQVEYGQKWLVRFEPVINLLEITGYAMGSLFFMAAVFFVANTIRLCLYQRREELSIMRLVGATEGFIKSPLYMQALLQGALGGALGLLALYLAFRFISGSIGRDFSSTFLTISFLSPKTMALIICGSMFTGWLGCYLSLKQFFKS